MASAQSPPPISIPDHELLVRIGEGSYGEVWLGRTALGTYRAIKIVRRATFNREEPFLRELKGLRLYEPVSRAHPSLIDILQIGPPSPSEYFYYIMEIGDDVAGSHPIDPTRYEPRTLAHDLSERPRLSVAECTRIGLALSEALAHLHDQKLLHRDIKPANILFVEGVPKLADIGMVADAGATASIVGTAGFIPPEGPSSVQSDIFSLGKVLYEASTGNDRCSFPTLPDNLDQWSDAGAFREFNEILIKACDNHPQHRYKSAHDMNADLVVLRSGHSVKRLRVLERYLTRARRIAPAAAVLLILVASLIWTYLRDQSREHLHRQRQVGSAVALGMQRVDQHDFLGALPPLVSALVQDDPSRKSTHRVRIAAVLDRCPRIVSMFFHSNVVAHVEFSHDGDRLLTVERDGKARIWDFRREVLAAPIIAPPYGMTHASFHPDGSTVVTGGLNQPVIVWAVESGERIAEFPHPSEVFSVRFSRDGRRILTAAHDGLVRVFDLAGEEMVASLSAPETQSVRYATFSRDDSLVAMAGEDRAVWIWNALGWQLASEALQHGQWVICSAFDGTGRLVATGGFDRHVRVWDWENGRELLPRMVHQECVASVSFSPDDRFILSGSWDGTARLWNASDHQPVSFANTLHHSRAVRSAGFHPSGGFIATACADGSVRVWDMAASAATVESPDASLLVLDEHLITKQAGGFSIASARGKTTVIKSSAAPGAWALGNGVLAALCQRSEPAILVWELADGNLRFGPIPVSVDFTVALACSATGAYVALAESDRIRVLNTSNGKVISLDSIANPAAVSAMRFAPQRPILFVAAGESLYAWNCAESAPVFSPVAHPAPIKALAISPNGRFLATGAQDNQLRELHAQLWDAATGIPIGPRLRHLDGVLDVAFCPNSEMLATGGEDGVAILWDVPTGTPRFRFRHAGQVRSVAFSGNGKWLATASTDRTARIWETETGEAITPALTHPNPVADAHFIHQDSALLTIDRKGNQLKWPVQPELRSTADLTKLSILLSSDREGFLGDSERDWQKLWKSVSQLD